MFYSNGGSVKTTVDSWYQTNITDKGYDSYVVNGTFYEQAKVKSSSRLTSGSATMDVYTSYTPNFKCATDGNGKGVINSKVGLINIDEVMHAGGYPDKSNSSYYLYDGRTWTMSPSGFVTGSATVWFVNFTGSVGINYVNSSEGLRSVINLNVGTLATGTGTRTDPYVIQTN